MSVLPLIRFTNQQKWVPPTDIDGVDANPTICSDLQNIKLLNGFIVNDDDSAPANIFGSNVLVAIKDDGYTILSSKSFTHSKRGDNTVTIAWNESASAADRLRIYVNDDLLKIADWIYELASSSEWEFNDKPQHINYNLVNDQFKINLNCSAEYTSLNILVDYLNLTLVYIDETVSYIAGNIERTEGWYLVPRWLGWNSPDKYTFLSGSTAGEYKDDFSNGITIPNLNLSAVYGGSYNCELISIDRSRGGVVHSVKGIGKANNSIDTSIEAGFYIEGVRNIKQIEISPYLNGRVALTETFKITVGVYIPSDDEYTVIRTIEHDSTPDEADVIFINGIYDEPVIIYVIIYVPYYSADGRTYDNRLESNENTAMIRNLKLISNDFCIVALYEDGQRALLNAPDKSGIFDMPVLAMYYKRIDWRVEAYEVYMGTGVEEDEEDMADDDYEDTQIYKLISEDTEPDGTWTLNDDLLTCPLKDVELTDTTLNYNYNLPADIDSRVDNQRLILREATLSGRVYFVNGEYKVYQSHVLANMAIQADSFPYDEDEGFGYFITSQDKVNVGVAISPIGDLLIFTNKGLMIYRIQSSGNSVYRQLVLLTGDISLSSIDSIASNLNGDPATDGNFWCDLNGVYYYVGGMETPKNIILQTHEEYWKAIPADDKKNAVGFFNKRLREYWLRVGNVLMAYEPNYDNWKIYNIALPDEYIGEMDNIEYYRVSDNVYLHGKSSPAPAILTTHRNTGISNGASIPSRFDKILQEVYMEFGNSDDCVVYLQVYYNNISIATYEFNTKLKLDSFLTPAGIRFNDVHFKITIPRDKRVRIKEFGCSFSEDYNKPIGLTTAIQPSTAGYGFDYGLDYGQAQ